MEKMDYNLNFEGSIWMDEEQLGESLESRNIISSKYGDK